MHVYKADKHGERTEEERHWIMTEPGEDAVDRFRQRGVGPEDDHPGVDADEEVAPEGQDDEQQKQIAVAFRAPGNQRGERIREREAEERSEQRVPHRLEKDLGVDRLLEEASVALQVEIEPAFLV